MFCNFNIAGKTLECADTNLTAKEPIPLLAAVSESISKKTSQQRLRQQLKNPWKQLLPPAGGLGVRGALPVRRRAFVKAPLPGNSFKGSLLNSEFTKLPLPHFVPPSSLTYGRSPSRPLRALDFQI